MPRLSRSPSSSSRRGWGLRDAGLCARLRGRRFLSAGAVLATARWWRWRRRLPRHRGALDLLDLSWCWLPFCSGSPPRVPRDAPGGGFGGDAARLARHWTALRAGRCPPARSRLSSPRSPPTLSGAARILALRSRCALLSWRRPLQLLDLRPSGREGLALLGSVSASLVDRGLWTAGVFGPPSCRAWLPLRSGDSVRHRSTLSGARRGCGC